MKRLILLLPLLAACAGPAPQDQADLGRLHLLAPLSIPAASATVRLQYGRPVERNAVQEHDPFCVFELDSVGDGPQTVAPDSFRISAIGHAIDDIAAALPAPIRVGLGDKDGPSHLYFKTMFRLASAAQPRVRLLTCMHNVVHQPHRARHLRLEEIRAALGDAFRLTPGR